MSKTMDYGLGSPKYSTPSPYAKHLAAAKAQIALTDAEPWLPSQVKRQNGPARCPLGARPRLWILS